MSSHNKDGIGRRASIRCRTTDAVKDAVRKSWDARSNPDAFKFPHPKNSKRDLNFTSEAEFIEFVLKGVSQWDDTQWNTFAFREYKGECIK